jgi:5'-3' exonuclease
MGIPSYFRHLTRSVDGLLTNDAPLAALATSWLCFDFNCIIYHVLQRIEMRDEAHLLDEVVRYTMKIVRKIEPENGVYLAVDGVVPMAKVKQQRMRRFRSAGTGTGTGSGFSRNAITPGTEFMSNLGKRLRKMAADHRDINWKLSLADEGGEGEHKVLNFIRGMPSPDNIIIYGLDADLIVLSLIALLEKNINRISLFREVVEDGQIQRDALGEEEFHFFSINLLASYLSHGSRGYLEDYCNAMMLLGNDFLPTAMTFRIKDDGHTELCNIIRQIRSEDGILSADSTPIANLVTGIFERLAADEQSRFYKSCKRKLGTVIREDSADAAPQEQGPLHWKGERIFFESDEKTLRRNWRDIYYNKCLGGVNKEKLVSEYWKGMRWVIDYYRGAPVDSGWMYAWHYPPLWEDLVHGFWTTGPVATGSAAAAPVPAPMTATEQLALVLPIESWHLLPAGCKERALPRIAPEWFPRSFGLTHIGRRWLWECEPDIPIPTLAELRGRLGAIF